MNRLAWHVMSSISGGWAVRRSGAKRATRIFNDKWPAVTFARQIARKERGELYVHGRDGMVREKRNWRVNI